MKTTSTSTVTESLLVSFRYGKASYVLLMNEDGTTTELRGAAMWRWLRESLPALLNIPWRKTSSQTSLPYERNEPDSWRETAGVGPKETEEASKA